MDYVAILHNTIPGPGTIQFSVTEEEKEGGDLTATDIEAIKCHHGLEVSLIQILTLNLIPESKGAIKQQTQ